MCIIASIPQNKQISKATLKRCWENNPHGGGFMFTDGKKVHTHKEMSSFKRYWREFLNKREQYPQSNFVCHFRISTHGKINETNCHPFLVNDKLGFVHNGIIRNAPVSPDYSDTYMFNATILQNLPKDFMGNVSVLTLIKEYIGSGSKLCFLSSDNRITFVNESAGVWDDGIWYSNSGYKENKYYDAGGTRVATYGTTYGNYKPYYGSNVKQSSFGFASAAFPPEPPKKKEPKFKSYGFEDALKKDKIDECVIEFANSKDADKYTYDEHCAFCDKVLSTYNEKNNGYCHHCEDRYTEWSF
jgi:glutamine amidotransferase